MTGQNKIRDSLEEDGALRKAREIMTQLGIYDLSEMTNEQISALTVEERGVILEMLDR